MMIFIAISPVKSQSNDKNQSIFGIAVVFDTKHTGLFL